MKTITKFAAVAFVATSFAAPAMADADVKGDFWKKLRKGCGSESSSNSNSDSNSSSSSNSNSSSNSSSESYRDDD